MKKFIAMLLALCILCSFACAEESDKKIIMNGVNVVMIQDDKIIKPIEENGMLYVPLEAFLKAINMEYVQTGDSFIITSVAPMTPGTSQPQAQPQPQTEEPEDYYAQLSDAEKKFMDNFLKGVGAFKNPSSVRIVSVYDHKTSPGILFFTQVSAQNGFGGNSVELYLCFAGFIAEVVDEEEYWKNRVAADYDIQLLNKALKQKMAEDGY